MHSPALFRPALTLRQASEALGVHLSTLRVWCQKGVVKATKPGRDWRIRSEEIDRLLSEPPDEWKRHQTNVKKEFVIPIDFMRPRRRAI